jgi:arsenate reductase (thioredoxin)
MGDSAKRHWKILFICIGNCVRSQMAEALARRDASDVIVPESAGLHPLGFIDKTAIAVLAERGVSVAGQFSKGLHDKSLCAQPDLVINMSGRPSAAFLHHGRYEEWNVEDPFGESMELHRRICDDIERRVKELAARLRATSGGAS